MGDLSTGHQQGHKKFALVTILAQLRIQPTQEHTHTYTVILRLFWVLSGTTWVSRYQKGKTRKVKPIWITGARDSEWQ